MAGIPGGESLHKLVFAVLEHGMRSVGTSEGLAPALVEETGTGDRTIRRFSGGELDALVTAARKAAGTSTAERVAICWDGLLTGRDGDERAIMVIAQERGQQRSLVFAQRYTLDGAKVAPEGRPGLVAERASVLG
ncbi:hypothetical protein QQX09_02950 [Demequina sp. SYSU T00192]|uniref:Uncharacterized protein n=1 Tax=Demequina litoralis TaxID=3051660 RepID=A0ABT8G6P0_9MICO|nr:hypothetical protein [Demequina sp. SYSU T00192]MDN4474810.1 hypothetical protein [Demequina sp. SYSU T00192]